MDNTQIRQILTDNFNQVNQREGNTWQVRDIYYLHSQVHDATHAGEVTQSPETVAAKVLDLFPNAEIVGKYPTQKGSSFTTYHVVNFRLPEESNV